jgi:DNA-binding winged helix-turn-helix (wHTH) protein
MQSESSVAPLRFDRFELDEADARLMCGAEPVALAPKPFAVLCALARTPGRLVTKNALLDLVWGHRFVTDSVLKSAISEVRAALDDDSRQPRYIETVSRRGYRFIAAATGTSSQRAPAIEGNFTAARDHPALTVLAALCRGDAALAELIRAVAATLERERLVLNES